MREGGSFEFSISASGGVDCFTGTYRSKNEGRRRSSQLETHPQKLERALLNLAVNACEAAPNREGKIAFDILATSESFEIRVSDNGPGIPAAIRSNLFDPFVSAGKPNGTGLGLAIVSKIVADHGGSIRVESTSETGTTFLVKLPRVQVSPKEIPEKVTT